MHLLITADTLGGVWTYSQELVTGLVRRGVQVTLVSFGNVPEVGEGAGPGAVDTGWMDGLRGLDYRPTAFRLEWMQDSEQDIRASSEYLLDLVQEVRPDLLHLNQYCYGALAVNLPKVVVAHSDVFSWWTAVHGHEPEDSPWVRSYHGIVARGLETATAVVAPSAWMFDELLRHYAPQEGAKGRRAARNAWTARGRIIYNGRNPGAFNPHSSKEDLVVSVGRLWDAGKQVSLLLEHDHKIPVSIAGPEKHPDEVMRGVRPAYGARRNVGFCGYQSHPKLAQLLSRASIYAATSRYEPFGLAPLEAALSRCALITNDIPAFREVWGEAALYFDRNDARSLAHTIERLRADRTLLREYANRAYEHARNHYTGERMVDEYMRLYESLLPHQLSTAGSVQAGIVAL